MAHVPKTINRGFQDKSRVFTLRGLDQEKMREMGVKLASTIRKL